VRKRFGVGQVVDGDEINVWITKRRAKNISPNTTEPVNTNLNRHCRSPPTLNNLVSIVGQALSRMWDRFSLFTRANCL
jgi:hypothetical protein